MSTVTRCALPARLVARYAEAQPGTYYAETCHRTPESLGNAVGKLAEEANADGYQVVVVITIRRAA